MIAHSWLIRLAYSTHSARANTASNTSPILREVDTQGLREEARSICNKMP